jgi:hypothetical protein
VRSLVLHLARCWELFDFAAFNPLHQSQLLFGPRWTEGAGAGTGEDAEHYNAMESKRNKSTVKMAPESSTDVLTEAALGHNRAHNDAMADTLIKRWGQGQLGVWVRGGFRCFLLFDEGRSREALVPSA